MTKTEPAQPRRNAGRMAIRALTIVGWGAVAVVAWAITYALLVLGGH